MRALTLVADRQLVVAELPPPPAGPGEVQIRVKAVALNHIDVWGYRGMAFAKRKLPLVVGAEASGEIAAVGDRRHALQAGPDGGDVRRPHLRRSAAPAARAATISAKTSPASWAFTSTALRAN